METHTNVSSCSLQFSSIHSFWRTNETAYKWKYVQLVSYPQGRFACIRKCRDLSVYKVKPREVKHPPRASTALEGATWPANRYWAPGACSLPLLLTQGRLQHQPPPAAACPQWLSDWTGCGCRGCCGHCQERGVAILQGEAASVHFRAWASKQGRSIVLDLPLQLPVPTSDQSQQPNFITFVFGVQSIYNVLVSNVQQSKSVMFPIFFRFFSHIGHYKVMNWVLLCYTVGFLSYLFYIYIYIYIYI